jgi:general secretion pathway protein N
MSFRHVLLGVVSGLCAISIMEISSLGATPRDDSAQYEVDRRSINIEEDSTKVTNERLPSGNPLWAIPLGSLPITRERPIFSPSRRPPAPATVVAPHVEPVKQAVKPAGRERPSLMLIGTVVGKSEVVAVFVDTTSLNAISLKIGQTHAGWVLRSVEGRTAAVQKGGQIETLSLPKRQQRDDRGPREK